MTPTKLLIGQILIVFAIVILGVWAATQWAAAMLGYQPELGAPWFRLGALIPGWQTALREMPAGARWRVVIPAEQAYGAEGAGDLIPPNAPLVFEVELLEVAD